MIPKVMPEMILEKIFEIILKISMHPVPVPGKNGTFLRG